MKSFLRFKLAKVLIFSTILLIITIKPAEIRSQVLDTDNDGLSDILETTVHYTNPNAVDTDSDGYSDKEEVERGFSPIYKDKELRSQDTDKDGLWDDWEIMLGTDLRNPDTDGDLFVDGLEVKHGFGPKSLEKKRVSKKIEVDLKTQTLKYYFGEVKLDEFKISSGLKYTPTPPGQYSVLKKRPVVYYAGVGYSYPNTKWNLMFKPGNGLNYYIHGAYWHNDFGKPKSHGCVNVPHKYEYMGRLYDWANEGTPVSIY